MDVLRLRPVVVPWTCHSSGDCCTQTATVVMTAQERAEIEAVSDRALSWSQTADGFESLAAGPCPLLDRDESGKARCTVYAVRPYNCRRFLCGRVSPEREAYEATPSGQCLNTVDRLAQSRPFRSFARKVQRQAQAWADTHGWGPQ